MNLKKSLRNTLMAAVIVGMATPCYANKLPLICWLFVVCNQVDAITAVTRAVNIAAQKRLMQTDIDATAGFQKILNNIGQGEGPGVSATGNTGADLITEEEGAKMQEEQAKRAATVPDVHVTLISDEEKNADGHGFYRIREANYRTLLADYCSTCTQSSTTGSGECYKFSQKTCSDSEKRQINAGCSACSQRTNNQCTSYDSTECAKERQNEWLFTATTGTAGEADASRKTITAFRKNLIKMLRAAGSSGTVSGFWSDLQNLSVQANAIVPEIVRVESADLLTTSLRHVMEQEPELKTLPSEEDGNQ